MSLRTAAVIAPSSREEDRAAFERAEDRFAAAGWRLKPFFDFAEADTRFAASDGQRLGWLHRAVRDPAVELVLILRGGYGLTRLLPAIDWEMMRQSPARFVGYSDFTAFLMGNLAFGGQNGFAGPTVARDFGLEQLDAATERWFWQALADSAVAIPFQTDRAVTGSFEGPIWGGNLCLLTSLVGTPFLPRIEGGLLVLEDVDEAPYRVERMLLQLLQAGVLSRQQAVVLGDITGAEPGPGDHGYTLHTAIAHIREFCPVPVLTGLPFGHTSRKATLPMGRRALLTVAGHDATLAWSTD
ncbi:MAG: hypothetical protein EAZ99_07055 [Alphaproteobacteria bacterium]|nr:LD-carboxypeptidase [Alphaproteobacteria bacterium]TAD90185.1 MAG: hypothetical protein EAZ99_07055 [Alphaproteobacteria bacterium]